MPVKKCEELSAMIDALPSDEKDFILWYLLGKYESECMKYANANDNDAGEYARLTANKARDIETLLCYDLW